MDKYMYKMVLITPIRAPMFTMKVDEKVLMRFFLTPFTNKLSYIEIPCMFNTPKFQAYSMLINPMEHILHYK